MTQHFNFPQIKNQFKAESLQNDMAMLFIRLCADSHSCSARYFYLIFRNLSRQHLTANCFASHCIGELLSVNCHFADCWPRDMPKRAFACVLLWTLHWFLRTKAKKISANNGIPRLWPALCSTMCSHWIIRSQRAARTTHFHTVDSCGNKNLSKHKTHSAAAISQRIIR